MGLLERRIGGNFERSWGAIRGLWEDPWCIAFHRGISRGYQWLGGIHACDLILLMQKKRETANHLFIHHHVDQHLKALLSDV